MHSKALRLPPEVVKKVEETRNQFFKYVHEILIQRLVDDVLRVMTDDDRFGLSPTSLERAPIWQDLKTVCNEAADQLAGFAIKFVSSRKRLSWIESHLDDWQGTALGNLEVDSASPERSIAELASLVLLSRRGIGQDSSRRIMEDKVRESIRGAKRHALLRLHDTSNSALKPDRTAKRIRQQVPIDRRKELIARIKARSPVLKARSICVELDKAIERATPVTARTLAPLGAWTEKAEGKRAWQDLYDAKVTRTLVRAHINKVPALRTRI